MKISAERIKKAVGKAIKGAGNNSLIPLTGMMGIKKSAEHDNLSFLTTDGRNTLQINVDKVQGEAIDITVSADLFGKLISKITSDTISLEVSDSYLKVEGNGSYKVPLIYDEEGPVKFPDIEFKPTEEYKEINKTSITSIYNTNKNALAKTMENPFLTGYYLGEKAVSTDINVICFNDINLFGETVLVAPQMMDLLTLIEEEKIRFYKDDNKLLFETPTVTVYGTELEDKNLYPIDDINAYLGESFPSVCEVPKALLISVLDRLALFIEPYDRNGAYFRFTDKGIEISSRKNASIEIINYTKSENFKAFNCYVDIPMTKQQIEAIPADTITLHYGIEAALKVTSGNITQIISLLEDDIDE